MTIYLLTEKAKRLNKISNVSTLIFFTIFIVGALAEVYGELSQNLSMLVLLVWGISLLMIALPQILKRFEDREFQLHDLGNYVLRVNTKCEISELKSTKDIEYNNNFLASSNGNVLEITNVTALAILNQNKSKFETHFIADKFLSTSPRKLLVEIGSAIWPIGI